MVRPKKTQGDIYKKRIDPELLITCADWMAQHTPHKRLPASVFGKRGMKNEDPNVGHHWVVQFIIGQVDGHVQRICWNSHAPKCIWKVFDFAIERVRTHYLSNLFVAHGRDSDGINHFKVFSCPSNSFLQTMYQSPHVASSTIEEPVEFLEMEWVGNRFLLFGTDCIHEIFFDDVAALNKTPAEFEQYFQQIGSQDDDKYARRKGEGGPTTNHAYKAVLKNPTEFQNLRNKEIWKSQKSVKFIRVQIIHRKNIYAFFQNEDGTLYEVDVGASELVRTFAAKGQLSHCPPFAIHPKRLCVATVEKTKGKFVILSYPKGDICTNGGKSLQTRSENTKFIFWSKKYRDSIYLIHDLRVQRFCTRFGRLNPNKLATVSTYHRNPWGRKETPISCRFAAMQNCNINHDHRTNEKDDNIKTDPLEFYKPKMLTKNSKRSRLWRRIRELEFYKPKMLTKNSKRSRLWRRIREKQRFDLKAQARRVRVNNPYKATKKLHGRFLKQDGKFFCFGRKDRKYLWKTRSKKDTIRKLEEKYKLNAGEERAADEQHVFWEHEMVDRHNINYRPMHQRTLDRREAGGRFLWGSKFLFNRHKEQFKRDKKEKQILISTPENDYNRHEGLF